MAISWKVAYAGGQIDTWFITDPKDGQVATFHTINDRNFLDRYDADETTALAKHFAETSMGDPIAYYVTDERTTDGAYCAVCIREMVATNNYFTTRDDDRENMAIVQDQVYTLGLGHIDCEHCGNRILHDTQSE